MSFDTAFFIFESDRSRFLTDRDFFVEIPPGISGKEELFSKLSQFLRLPEYFGRNWDALEECLRDLSWILERRIVIFHHDLPMSGQQRDQLTYLSILPSFIKDWKESDEHDLRIVFHPSCRDEVNRLSSQD